MVTSDTFKEKLIADVLLKCEVFEESDKKKLRHVMRDQVDDSEFCEWFEDLEGNKDLYDAFVDVLAAKFALVVFRQ